jgi:hypothetical protein
MSCHFAAIFYHTFDTLVSESQTRFLFTLLHVIDIPLRFDKG